MLLNMARILLTISRAVLTSREIKCYKHDTTIPRSAVTQVTADSYVAHAQRELKLSVESRHSFSAYIDASTSQKLTNR